MTMNDKGEYATSRGIKWGKQSHLNVWWHFTVRDSNRCNSMSMQCAGCLLP